MDARAEVVVRARADVVGRADDAGSLGSAAKDVGRSKIEVGSANERSREAPRVADVAGVAKTGRTSGAFFSGDLLGRREATREVRGVCEVWRVCGEREGRDGSSSRPDRA